MWLNEGINHQQYRQHQARSLAETNNNALHKRAFSCQHVLRAGDALSDAPLLRAASKINNEISKAVTSENQINGAQRWRGWLRGVA